MVNTHRILLIGSTGQIGWELARTLMPLGRIIVPERNQCDLARLDTLTALTNASQPDVIVNAAAYTAVDKAEEETNLAMTVNGRAPGALATAARRHGALLVHYSTDYIFDGAKAGAYSEADAPSPGSWHGFASDIIMAARARGAALACRKVVPIMTAEYPLPAARPANSRLSGARLAERYGLEMPAWECGMHLCLAEISPA